MIFRFQRVFLLFVLQLFPLTGKVDCTVTIAISFGRVFHVNSPQILHFATIVAFLLGAYENVFVIFSLKFENFFAVCWHFRICIYFIWHALSFMYMFHCFFGLWVISFAPSASPFAISPFGIPCLYLHFSDCVW